jgi:hypothetical protein
MVVSNDAYRLGLFFLSELPYAVRNAKVVETFQLTQED